MTAVPGFEPGDKVWPKTGSTMALQRAPQVVLASHRSQAPGEWLWLEDDSGCVGTWHAANWTTEEPDDAEKAARAERARRVDEESRRLAAKHPQRALDMTFI